MTESLQVRYCIQQQLRVVPVSRASRDGTSAQAPCASTRPGLIPLDAHYPAMTRWCIQSSSTVGSIDGFTNKAYWLAPKTSRK